MAAPPALIDVVFSSGLKTMPPAQSDRIQSTERSGPFHTSDESSGGTQHAGHLGHGACLVDPVPGRLGNDDVTRELIGGDLLGTAG